MENLNDGFDANSKKQYVGNISSILHEKLEAKPSFEPKPSTFKSKMQK